MRDNPMDPTIVDLKAAPHFPFRTIMAACRCGDSVMVLAKNYNILDEILGTGTTQVVEIGTGVLFPRAATVRTALLSVPVKVLIIYDHENIDEETKTLAIERTLGQTNPEIYFCKL